MIEAAGHRYGGWKDVSVSRSIEAFAGSFSFTTSERSPTDPTGRPLRKGDSVVVRCGATALVTGFIDKLDPKYDPRSHDVVIRGRSKTQDLVDCSAVHDPGEWHDRTLQQIAADLVEPFGIKIRAETSTGAAFPTFKLEPSERVHGVITRAAAQRAVLVTDSADGDLVFTRVGPDRVGVVLRRGERIRSARGTFSDRDRYSSITVKGQRRSSDSDGDTPQVSISATALDKGVGRHRPLEIIVEEPGSKEDLQQRANWEATSRQAQALRAVLRVQDWFHPGGLWLPNQRVHVEDSWLGIRREMLIAGVSWILDSNGRRSELTIAPPEAFDVLPAGEISAASGEIWTN